MANWNLVIHGGCGLMQLSPEEERAGVRTPPPEAELTLEEAAQLIDERAAKGPAKGKGKKKAASKKAPAKKAAAKKK